MRIMSVLLLPILIGCAAVGPNYVPPKVDLPENWKTPVKDGLNTDVVDPETLASWWSVLHDPTLKDLIKASLKGNLDLKQAGSRVHEARARRTVSRASHFPFLDGAGSVIRSRQSETGSGASTQNVYAVGFDAGWEIDIFGGVSAGPSRPQMPVCRPRRPTCATYG